MPAYLDVVAEAPMGQLVDFTLSPGQAALVHTGGMVPAGADAVVMIEQTHRAGGPMFGGRALQPDFEPYAIEVYKAVAGGDSCIFPGEDIKAGEIVLDAGHGGCVPRISADCSRSGLPRWASPGSPESPL